MNCELGLEVPSGLGFISPEGTAGKLLERIREEKGRLVKEGKTKKEEVRRSLPELHHGIPLGWEYIFLGEVVELISGQHLGQDEQNNDSEGLPYLTGPSDFGLLHPIITRWTTMLKSIAIGGDILITVKGAGVGKSNILNPVQVAIGRQLMAIRSLMIDNFYIYLLINASYETFQNLGTGSTVPGFGRKDILNFPFLFPPNRRTKTHRRQS